MKMNLKEKGLVFRLIRLARRSHYYCEDQWYSCPKHPDGCYDDRQGTECNCSADRINTEIDKVLEELGLINEIH